MPYGYDDPEEAATLRHVEARRRDGATWPRICDELTGAGRFKRSGRAWSPPELQRTHARSAARTPIEPERLSLGQGILV